MASALANTTSKVAKLAQDLIRIESVTPKDGGCQDIVRHRLNKVGFACETLRYHDVTNLWAHRGLEATNDNKPLVVFVGHTDVVPPGPLEDWKYPPFEGIIDQNTLYGRGAVDMKGGISSFVVALEHFLSNHTELSGSIGIILTSDEEGKAGKISFLVTIHMKCPFRRAITYTNNSIIEVHGTKMVLQELAQRGIQIHMSIVGEPSSMDKVGDVIKIGRRGSLGGELTIKGIQGHVAYPHQSINPIHESLGALKELIDMKWDDGTADFGPTTFQISNINAGTGATNVTPGFKKVVFNFRFSPASTEETLKSRVEKVLENHSLNYEIDWHEVRWFS